jgi:hypothetical protein
MIKLSALCAQKSGALSSQLDSQAGIVAVSVVSVVVELVHVEQSRGQSRWTKIDGSLSPEAVQSSTFSPPQYSMSNFPLHRNTVSVEVVVPVMEVPVTVVKELVVPVCVSVVAVDVHAPQCRGHLCRTSLADSSSPSQ